MSNHPLDQTSSPFRDFTVSLQWIFRHCAPTLTPAQTCVLCFIADRTVGWGKRKEVITRNHFLNGIHGDDGAVHAGALNITRPTLVACLKHLVQIGVVTCTKSRTLTTYEINFHWADTNQKHQMGLAKPKRLQSVQTAETVESPTSFAENDSIKGGKNFALRGKEFCPTQGKNFAPKKSKEKKSKEKKVFPTGKQREDFEGQEMSHSLAEEQPSSDVVVPSIDETFESVSARSRESRSKRLAKWTRATVSPIWHDLHRIYIPEGKPFTVTNVNQLALLQYGKKWMASCEGRGVEDLTAYLAWVISNWRAITSENFSWMKPAPPALPVMAFVVQWGSRFEQAHENRATLEALSQMSTRDREIESRVLKGMNRDVAVVEVDERLGLMKERERMERAASVLKRQNISAHRIETDRMRDEIRRQAHRDMRARIAPATTVGPFGEWED